MNFLERGVRKAGSDLEEKQGDVSGQGIEEERCWAEVKAEREGRTCILERS